MRTLKLLTLAALVISTFSCWAQTDNTVSIGDQIWMCKNLNVAYFSNGDPIPEAKTEEEWLLAEDEEKPAWCYYDNDPANGEIYGKLYNWHAVHDPRGLAPKGWHVPSDAEWKELEMALGMSRTEADDTGERGIDADRGLWIIIKDFIFRKKYAGGKLKEAGNSYWKSPNTGATNESGFSALPGGCRETAGGFYDAEYTAHFWTSTEYHESFLAWCRRLSYNSPEIGRNRDDKASGLSVRCIKD